MNKLIKKKRLAREYRQKLEKAETLSEQMMYRVFVEMIENPTEEIWDNLNEENAILTFRRTFLSNFHEVSIHYDGSTYPSVEHAYQLQKFTDGILRSIKREHLDEIADALRERGFTGLFYSGEDIFNNQTLSAGDIKIAADILRDLGYVRKGWDDDKIKLMADLLLAKFKHPQLQRELIATGDKYLVEGNDWNDTLWGICNGRGRNLLGLMLMDISNQIIGNNHQQ